jgi:S-adenosylmethionine:tRNA ribosyltransferase-isomerase
VRVDLFDFDLPDDRIALRPARPRDTARLLVVDPGGRRPLADHAILDLPDLLDPRDILVFNDTRVLRAQLTGLRHRDGHRANISLTLLQPISTSRWRALARPAKRLKAGDRITFGHGGDACLAGTLAARVEGRGDEGEVTLAFDFHGPALDEAIATLGAMPLPPYIASKRGADAQDIDDYQTLYAKEDGAVAAPTAGLHFTGRLFDALAKRGIAHRFVTLHVGPGTFFPVRADDTAAHRMHGERGEISAETAKALNAARAAGGRIICVGTTALRLLESAADREGVIHPFAGETDIFITPGYTFKAVDLLMTNFHLPRSTLFMLVSAFSGLATMKDAYAHAIEHEYRFYSYGDACLLTPESAGP